jgi:hypothetical protein
MGKYVPTNPPVTPVLCPDPPEEGMPSKEYKDSLTPLTNAWTTSYYHPTLQLIVGTHHFNQLSIIRLRAMSSISAR